MDKAIAALYAHAPTDAAAWIAACALEMTIDGADAPAAATASLTDPCTQRTIATCPQAELGHVDLAVAAAKRAFPGWAHTSWEHRRAALDRFAGLLVAEQDVLATILACESGRPLWRAWNEVAFAVRYVRIIAAVDLPPVRLDRPGLQVEFSRRPLGVACAIAPWNGPVILALAKIANALLAGDTLVLRPSPFTPLSALFMGRLARAAFPPGVLNVITGDASVGAAMTTHPDVAKISFTGSTETGKRIAIAAAQTLKRVTLELGGNDAAIVLADADVDALVNTLFEVSLGNAGHFCAAVKRLYIHEAIYDDVRAALIEKAQAAVLGTSFDPAATMGPVQNRPQFDRIWALFDEAVANGGRVLTGGQRIDGPGLFIPPTLVEGIGHGVALVDEEQFGPVLPLMRFADEDSAIAMANDSIYGLGGSVWTADIDRGIAFANRLEVGTGWINQHGAFSAALPMPFAKQSGIGMDYAEYGVAEHSRAMLINARLP